MRFLVAGVTGQLGRGLVSVAPAAGVEIVPLVRRVRHHDARRRVAATFPDRPDLAEAAVEGDVTLPRWGLGERALERLAGEVDGVLDVAAETNWAASERRLAAVNHLGALNGVEVARALVRLGGRCGAYCYAGSIHAAGGLRGTIAERPFGPDPRRTAYEQSKWLGEQAVLDAAHDGPPAIGVARVGGLVGDSRTGATAKRNSLYLLADGGVGRVLPIAPSGRVDMLARDVAAELLLAFARGVVRLASARAQLVHVCAGEAAPTIESVLAALRSLDRGGAVARPRTVAVPARPALWAADALQRVADLSPRAFNATVGLRYLTLDRVFERARLARFVPGPLPAPSAEDLVRLAFDVAPASPAGSDGRSRLARFAG